MYIWLNTCFRMKKKMKQNSDEAEESEIPLWDRGKAHQNELGGRWAREISRQARRLRARTSRVNLNEAWVKRLRDVLAQNHWSAKRKEKRVKRKLQYPWHKWFQELLNQGGWVLFSQPTTYRQAGDLVWQLPQVPKRTLEGPWWGSPQQAGPRRICS